MPKSTECVRQPVGEEPNRDYVIVGLPDGTDHFIYRQMQEIYTYRVDNYGHIRREVACVISYMPVKLAYAMTVHRSQGQTFDSIELDPSSHTSGQTYVGISRVRSIEGLRLTRRITARDIYLSPVVKEFYSHLGEGDYVPSRETALPAMEAVIRPSADEVIVADGADAIMPALHPETDISREGSVEVIREAEGAPCDMKEVDSSTRMGKSLLESTGDLTQDNDDKPVEEFTAPKRGRKKRYPGGSAVCRIPAEILEEVTAMLGLICPKAGMDMEELQRFRRAIREMCHLDSE